MDQPPKRRVLSLSLSQPAKQHKKLKMKKKPSLSPETCSQSALCDSSADVGNLRVSSSSPLSQLPDALASKLCRAGVECSLVSNADESLASVDCSSFTRTSEMCNEDFRAIKSTFEDLHDNHETLVSCESSIIEECSIPSSTLCVGRGLEKVLPETSPVFNKNAVNSSTENFEPSAPLLKEGKDNLLKLKCGNSSMVAPSPSHVSTLLKSKVEPFESKESIQGDCGESSEQAFPAVDDTGEEKGDVLNNNTFPEQGSEEVLQCPLCYKKFDKLSTKRAHLKSCASKHKLSTHQLLEALELQKRQAAERKALGLPEVPLGLGNSRKSNAPKKDSKSASKIDSNLQLAMALSLSLHDQERAIDESRKFDAAKGLSLDHFGFTNKPVLDAVESRPSTAANRGKAKAVQKKVPTLLTRSVEDRQRIITEKVAMVLLDEVSSGQNETADPINMKSTFLQDCQNKENLLWMKSHISPSKVDKASYYVNSLRRFISPSKVEAGSKIMHLSQVVGRVKTPTKEQKTEEVEMVLLSSPSDEEITSDSSSPQIAEPKSPSHIEMELRAKLFNDWAGMVNNPSMSDLTIYPQEGREIAAHKILLHVRCPRILSDISRQRNPLTGNEVDVIMWMKTPHAAALAFLEYVYCGSVKSIRVLSVDLSSMIWLANHYRITDLTRYLDALSQSNHKVETSSQVVLNVVGNTDKLSCVSNDSQTKELKTALLPLGNKSLNIEHHSIKNSLASRQAQNIAELRASPAGTTSRSGSESIYSEVTIPGPETRSICSSPDMFGDDDIIEAAEICVKSDGGDRSAQSTPTKKNSESDIEKGSRPASRTASISSDKTVVIDRKSHSNQDILDSHRTEKSASPLTSPTLSQASAATEVLDLNRSGHESLSAFLNDSKRKLSDGSQDDDQVASKRPCPINPNSEAQSVKRDSDVEFCDLTQDSDSNASFPTINHNFSGDSPARVILSSEPEISEMSDSELVYDKVTSRAVTPLLDKEASVPQVCDNFNSKHDSEKEGGDLHVMPSDSPNEGYVSPIWDGFEDLNYGDPFMYSQPPDNVMSPKEKSPVNPSSPIRNNDSSPSPEKQVAKSPVKETTVIKSYGVRGGQCRKSSSSSECEVTYQSPVKQKSPGSNFDDLFDDSFQVNDTILQQAEGGMPETLSQRQAKGTPVNRILSAEADNVTPLANYSAMKTPQLKRELQKFGLKPNLGKRKGKIMLRHIYNELHPWTAAESSGSSSSELLPSSQPSCANKVERPCFSISQPNSRKITFPGVLEREESSDSGPDDEVGKSDLDSDSDDGRRSANTSLHEIRFMESDCSDSEVLSQIPSRTVSKASLPQVFSELLLRDRELHRKILEYEPIPIEKLQSDLRSDGHKVKMVDLMAFLDEKCITFRTNQTGPRTKKRKPKEGNPRTKNVNSKVKDKVDLSD